MAYASSSDLTRLGVGAAAVVGIPSGEIATALDSASDLADSYLGARYTLPLVAWGDDLRRAVCQIAAYDVIAGNRGFNPEQGADVSLRLRYEDAIKWLERVAAGSLVPVAVIDSSPTTDEGSAFVITDAKRGW